MITTNEEKIDRIKSLQSEGYAAPLDLMMDARGRAAWRAKMISAVSSVLGPKHHVVVAMNRVQFHISPDLRKVDFYLENFNRNINDLCGLADAAIMELEQRSEKEIVDEHSFDPELWDHVKGLVELEDWEKVAANTAIFVEDKVRKWSDFDNEILGKGLYAKALGDSGELRLGEKKGEWEGWRFLGMGMAQAVGNVDRHRIQSRSDTKRYAIGVLGLGSLLLTQLKFQHATLIKERGVLKR